MPIEGKEQEEEPKPKRSKEEEEQKKGSNWIKLVEANPAFVTGIFALGVAVATGILALLGNTITALQTLETERRKYEFDLISEILSEKISEEEFDQKLSSERLQFLIKIGVIKSLNRRAIESIAKEGNLPTLPAPPLPATRRGRNPFTSLDDLSEAQALIGQCRKVVPVNGSVEVYNNTQLSAQPENRIGTIDAGTPMILTGIFREAEGDGGFTAVQVFAPNGNFVQNLGRQNVGWVDGSQITEC